MIVKSNILLFIFFISLNSSCFATAYWTMVDTQTSTTSVKPRVVLKESSIILEAVIVKENIMCTSNRSASNSIRKNFLKFYLTDESNTPLKLLATSNGIYDLSSKNNIKLYKTVEEKIVVQGSRQVINSLQNSIIYTDLAEENDEYLKNKIYNTIEFKTRISKNYTTQKYLEFNESLNIIAYQDDSQQFKLRPPNNRYKISSYAVDKNNLYVTVNKISIINTFKKSKIYCFNMLDLLKWSED